MRTLATAIVLFATVAAADPHDFRVSQFGNPATTPTANDDFRVFARELSAALTSVNLMPPETLGHSGFFFGAELAVVNFETDKFKFPTIKEFKGPMLLPSVHLR